MSQNKSLTPLKSFLFAFFATNTIILSFIPIYLKKELELSGTEIGWVLAIGPLAALISEPFWGYMSDKFKTVKRILIILLTALLLFSIVFFNVYSLGLILTFAFFMYFFSAPVGAFGDSLAQRRADELSISFGTIRTWGSIGFAVSALLAGQYLTWAGIDNIIWPYLLFGSFALLVAFRLTDAEPSKESVSLKSVKLLFQNKRLMLFLLFIMFITISHRTSDSFIGIYIVELGGTESLLGISWFVGVISEAAIFATAAFWFKKYHTLMFIIVAGVLYTIRWFLFGVIHDPWVVIGLQFLHGLTFAVLYLAAFDYITRLIPKVVQGTGHLMFHTVFFGVSGIIGSLMGGPIIDHYSANALYTVLGVFALVGTVLIIIYHVILNVRRA
ncbi:PPP family 3-phenylpropionic acid transporter [Alkalibacillus filiformis]|uniref:PPP family 3-phenylpropionic acid transporter n=1 Tax=Alkalibacillus filiformis TaxID=200990 RepID=A0ABU0DV36_9BACI|nr:MFS transporter [Alkalibacillus filiformis]MDQ0352291.1 PPP family 3-phenylpropionic acid transporter [Alkalibacillus filiformis]